MIYNIPGRTGINMTAETVKKCAEIPNIVALKEAAGSVDQMREFRQECPIDFHIYSGDDGLTLKFLEEGASGVVSVASHIAGEQIHKMITAFNNNDIKDAKSLDKILQPLFDVLFITSNPIPVKASLKLIGLNCGRCRPPLMEITEDQNKQVETVLDAFLKTFKSWLKNDDYVKLLKNVSSLSIVQLSNYILPLITLPYLARVLGPKYFGLVIMAQATMIYLTLLTDYGFNLSATKEIAKNQNKKSVIETLFSSVLTIKSGLLCIGTLILFLLTMIIPIFNEHSVLFWASYLIVIGNTFLPTFLFQGLEKMTFIACLNLIAKAGFTVLIFILIKSTDDYIWVHALWGISYILVDIGAFLIIKLKLNFNLVKPQLNQIKSILNISFEYFLSRIAIAIYLNTNVIFVGILLTPADAGIYGGAEKLLFAITTFYAPLIETIYPYLSRTKNKSFIKKILTAAIGVNSIGCMTAFFIAPIIIPIILGPEFKGSIILFQWMMIIAFLHLPSSMIGYPVLAALGYVKTANRSVILGAIIHVSLILIFYNKLSSPMHFIWIMIVSQSIILFIRLEKCVRVKALS